MKKEQQFDLQERLIQFAARIIKLAGALPKTDELIAVLFTSVQTARKNHEK